jgi:uncharacterized membrane protein YbhN (UPF0104 family)
MPEPPSQAQPASGGRRHWLRTALQLGAAFLGIHLLLPQLAGLEATGEALARTTWWVLLLVLLCEAVSFAAYGELELQIMDSGGVRPPRELVQRSTIVGFSLGRTLPGGSTTALALVVQALRAHGVDGVTATAAIAASGAVSSLVLVGFLPPAAMLAIVGGQIGGVALGAVGLGVAVAIAVGLLPLAIRNPDGAGDAVSRIVAKIAIGPLRGHANPEAAGAATRRGLRTVLELTRTPRVLRTVIGFAAANWLFDIAALTLIAATIGRGTPLTGLLLAYVIAQFATSIPITPGGVGVVETLMTASLVGAGAPAGAATATVLGWRLVSHWLPVLVGLAVLPTLSVSRVRRKR